MVEGAPTLTYRRLDYWTRTGLVHAIENDRSGSGVPRRYTEREAAVAALMARLMSTGLRLDVAAPVARQVIESNLAEIYLGQGVVLQVASLMNGAPGLGVDKS